MRNINYNGKIIPSNKFSIGIENRAFKYGDSLFETIRVFLGKIPFLEQHFQRLYEGLSILQYNIPKNFSLDFLRGEINKLTQEKGNHRVRLMVFRVDGGLYTPKKNNFHFLIETSPLKRKNFFFSKKGLAIGYSKNKTLYPSPISHLKTGNSLPYILAGLEKEKNNWDDCLILNTENKIAEAVSSNIYLIKKNKLITPSISSGCVQGVMRQVIIQKINIPTQEKDFTIRALKNADGILLSNSIQGIKWVRQFENRYFDFPVLGEEITQELNALIQDY